MEDKKLLESIFGLLLRPSHAVYFGFSILSAAAIYQAISKTLNNAELFHEMPYADILFSTILVTATFIHFIYIYLSLIETEEVNSFFSCWVNVKYYERLLRYISMIALIGVFGKFPASIYKEYNIVDYHLAVYCSVIVFFIFIIWNICANYFQIKKNIIDSIDSSWEKWDSFDWPEKNIFFQHRKIQESKGCHQDEKDIWKDWVIKEFNEDKKRWKRQLWKYKICDGIALLHWVLVACFLIFEEKYFLFASVLLILAYIGSILYLRIYKDWFGYVVIVPVFFITLFIGINTMSSGNSGATDNTEIIHKQNLTNE